VVKAVIFDLFHTLTAPEAEWSDLPWTSDVLGISRTDWYRALTVNSRQRLVGEISDPVEIVRLIAHSIDPRISPDLIARAAFFRTKRFIRVLSSIPASTLHVLRELRSRGARLGLVSNCDCSEISAWANSPLQGAFDAEVFSCHVGSAKPEPEIYLECLTRLGVAAAEAVFVGDGGSNELRGAREVGMCSILFSGVIAQMWPERIPQLAEGADAHITHLDALTTHPLIWRLERRAKEVEGEA
jgi:putative hydrolase of the HAD superfamily